MANGRQVLREGLVTGVIGYATVALFYALFDFLAARGGLFTLDLLGKVVFRGLRDPAVLQLPQRLDAAAMFAYNGLHLFLALAIGTFVAALVARLDERPGLFYPVVGILIAGYVITVVVIGSFVNGIAPLLPWWSIVVANTLAVVIAGAYLRSQHLALWNTINFGRSSI